MSEPAVAAPRSITPELTSYNANCHCGAVRFTVLIPSLKDHKVMSCNCSLCTRNGYLMIYPYRKHVLFHSGYDDDHLSSYPVLNKNVHKFCKVCGCSIIAESIGDDDDCVAINVRMIKDIDVDELKLQYYNGRAAKPEYTIGKLAPRISEQSESTTSESESDLEFTSYPANCHCGAVRYTVRVPSLSDEHNLVNNCNCSICVRLGYLFVYPDPKRRDEQLTFYMGEDHLRSYRFGVKKRAHKFCPTCGSSVMYEANDQLGINVRMFQDADPSKYHYSYFDGKTVLKPDYPL